MYREEQMELMKDFWHDGSVKELVQTLTHTISKEEKEEWMRKIENEEKVEVECKRSCIIEGMVHKELPIIAVQWHPELMHADPVSGTLDQDRMFVYFASMYE